MCHIVRQLGDAKPSEHFFFTVSTELEDVSSPLSLTKLLHSYGQGNWNKENEKMHIKESLHQKSYDYQV